MRKGGLPAVAVKRGPPVYDRTPTGVRILACITVPGVMQVFSWVD